MSAISPRRVGEGQPYAEPMTEPVALPGSEVPAPTSTSASASPDAPTDTEIAQEAAAIYPDTNVGRPTPDDIATDAYAIYMGRGADDGQDLDDWLKAERRLSRDRS